MNLLQNTLMSSPHLDQSLISQVYEESPVTAMENSLLKQRKKMVAALVVVLIVLLSTIISSACLGHQFNQNHNILQQLNTQIDNASQILKQKIDNQTIRFNSKDGLKLIKIVSNTPQNHSKIAVVDIKNSLVENFTQLKLPSLLTLQLPQSMINIMENTLGILYLNTSLKNLKQVRFNNLSQLKNLSFNGSGIKSFSSNILKGLRNLSIDNSQIQSFVHNDFSLLLDLSLQNNSKLDSLQLFNTSHLQELNLQGSNITTSFTLINTNLTNLKAQYYRNAKSIFLTDSPLERIECEYFPHSTSLYLTNLSIQVLNITIPHVQQLSISDMRYLEKIDIGYSVDQTKNQSVYIYLSSLTEFSNQNNSISNLTITNNHNLTHFNNNSMLQLFSFLCLGSPITHIQGNYLPNITVLVLDEPQQQNGGLTNFNFNLLSSLQSLDLSHQSLRSFRNNTLTSLISLNISSNNLEDGLARQILDLNVFSGPSVLSVDLSNNQFKEKEQIRKMYESKFPNCLVIL